jgi:DNA ligase (NAD+)
MAQDLAEAIQNSLVHKGGEFRIQNEWEMMNIFTNEEFLRWIYGIWEKSIKSITDFFNNENTRKIFEQLKEYWVNSDPKKYSDYIDADSAKWSFSITWSFDIPREKIADLFKQQGYIFHESPIKTTDFMLIGEKAGSKKTKAQELWITLYEWRDNITKQFSFLKNIPNKKKNIPTAQSLF